MAINTVLVNVNPTPIPGNLYTLGEFSAYPSIQKYTTTIDALALSCCNYRLTRETKKSRALTDDDLHSFMQTSDYEMAEKIRDFYGKRIIIWNLKGRSLSEYRKKLADIINQPLITEHTSLNIGVIYRLPDFYEYDIGIDTMKEQHFTNFTVEHEPEYVTKTLRPVTKFIKSNKLRTVTEYWFATEHNQGVALAVEQGNNLQGFWDKFFANEKEMKIRAKFKASDSLEFKHFKVIGTQWEMV